MALAQQSKSSQEVEELISEQQSQYARISVNREKLEFRKQQTENEDIGAELEQEIHQQEGEMKAIREDIESLEEK